MRYFKVLAICVIVISAQSYIMGGTKNEKTKSDYVSVNRNSVNNKHLLHYHIIKNGETLYSISRKYGISLAEILNINNIQSASKIYPGMKLKLYYKTGKSDINKNAVRSNLPEEKINEKEKNSGSADFTWPVKKIMSVSKNSINSKGIGIFIKSKPGTFVCSSADGKIEKVGYMRGYGNYVVISHGKRYISVYSMITITAKEGVFVKKGDTIGKIDDDNCGLHFQITNSGKPLDAEKFLPDRS